MYAKFHFHAINDFREEDIFRKITFYVVPATNQIKGFGQMSYEMWSTIQLTFFAEIISTILNKIYKIWDI